MHDRILAIAGGEQNGDVMGIRSLAFRASSGLSPWPGHDDVGEEEVDLLVPALDDRERAIGRPSPSAPDTPAARQHIDNGAANVLIVLDNENSLGPTCRGTGFNVCFHVLLPARSRKIHANGRAQNPARYHGCPVRFFGQSARH